MAYYQHERSRDVAVITARIVGHHHSSISHFELKIRHLTMFKTFRDKEDPLYHLLGKIKHNEGWSEGNPLHTIQS